MSTLSEKPEYQIVKALVLGNDKKSWKLPSGLDIDFQPGKVRQIVFSREWAFSDVEVDELTLIMMGVLGELIGVHPDHPLKPQVEKEASYWLVRYAWKKMKYDF